MLVLVDRQAVLPAEEAVEGTLVGGIELDRVAIEDLVGVRQDVADAQQGIGDGRGAGVAGDLHGGQHAERLQGAVRAHVEFGPEDRDAFIAAGHSVVFAVGEQLFHAVGTLRSRAQAVYGRGDGRLLGLEIVHGGVRLGAADDAVEDEGAYRQLREAGHHQSRAGSDEFRTLRGRGVRGAALPRDMPEQGAIRRYQGHVRHHQRPYHLMARVLDDEGPQGELVHVFRRQRIADQGVYDQHRQSGDGADCDVPPRAPPQLLHFPRRQHYEEEDDQKRLPSLEPIGLVEQVPGVIERRQHEAREERRQHGAGADALPTRDEPIGEVEPSQQHDEQSAIQLRTPHGEVDVVAAEVERIGYIHEAEVRL